MKYFVEAYNQEGTQILGNLDGQTVFQNGNYKRTKAYKALKAGNYEDGSLISMRAKKWCIVDEKGKTKETIQNPWHKERKE